MVSKKSFDYLGFKAIIHTHSKFVKIGLFALLAGASATQANTKFGFNYWPTGFSGPMASAVLRDANWNNYRDAAIKDLNTMFSLGAGHVVRIMVWSNDGSWEMSTPHFPSGYLDQQADNLVDFVKLCKNRKFKVIISFGQQRIGNEYWKNGYATWNDFLTDSLHWTDTYVDALEGSSAANAVLFYDIANEIRDNTNVPGNEDYYPYVKYIYDNSSIPAGKRGISFVHAHLDDPEDFDAYMGSSRPMDYVELHCYEATSGQRNDKYNNMATHLSGATLIYGETGSVVPTGSASEEATQANWLLDSIDYSDTKGMPYTLNWMLWDGLNGNFATHNHGLGYSPTEVKDAYGAVLSAFTYIPNPDMENGSGSSVDAWYMGKGSAVGSSSFTRQTGADSGDYYVRAKVNAGQSGGSCWITHNLVDCNPGAGLAFPNMLFRGQNVSNISIRVVQYDGSTKLADIDFPTQSVTSDWQNYLQMSKPWKNLNSNADRVRISIRFTANPTSSSPAKLEVDCVGMWND